MSIGEVVENLSSEFPQVSVSKVRFLESQGLVEPERTPSGYRKYSEGDVARLRYILRLQRDQFVPLKVIQQRLEHFDPAEQPALPDGESPPHVPPPEAEEDLSLATGLNLSLEELVSSSGLDPADLQELEEYGLIDVHYAEGQSYYDEDDLMVAKIARDFAKYGIEARHMKMYRQFADREFGLFEQVVVPRARAGGNGSRQTVQSFVELAKLSKRLKHILLKASLRQHSGA